MKRREFIAACAGTAAFGLAPLPALADAKRQALVDDAYASAKLLIEGPDFPDVRKLMPRTKAVLVVPALVQGGFIVGGAGGRGVMLARRAERQWSYPAFYFMGTGSVGLQIGGKVSEVLFQILTDKGMNAMLEDKFKFGAEAGITVVTIGGGIEGSTTSAVGADIVAFSKSRGLFAGMALEGSYVGPDHDWDQLYYGGSPQTRAILFEDRYSNPGANTLRSLLAKY